MESVQPDCHGGLANYMAATAVTGKRSVKEKQDKPQSTEPEKPATLRERAASYAEKAKGVSQQAHWYSINLADHDVSGDPIHVPVACIMCVCIMYAAAYPLRVAHVARATSLYATRNCISVGFPFP